ncbi:putative holin-like toxin [Cohnella sp. AR92]
MGERNHELIKREDLNLIISFAMLIVACLGVIVSIIALAVN